jgi:hypothetical protein
MGEIRNTYKILIGNSEVKTPPGRSKRNYEDDIKMDDNVTGAGDVYWIHVLRIGTSGGLLCTW